MGYMRSPHLKVGGKHHFHTHFQKKLGQIVVPLAGVNRKVHLRLPLMAYNEVLLARAIHAELPLKKKTSAVTPSKKESLTPVGWTRAQVHLNGRF